jgi:hypothetical protein
MRKSFFAGLALITVIGTITALASSLAPNETPKQVPQTTSTAPAQDGQQDLRRLFEAVPPSSWDKNRQMAKSMALKVRKRYAELAFLSMETTTQTNPKTVVVKDDSVMRPKAFTSKVSVDGVPLYDFAFEDGKITEHRFPFRGSPDQSIVYDVGENKNSGMGECRLQDGVPSRWLCLIAGHGETWVGPNIKMGDIQLLCDRLEEDSWLIGRETVDGFSCLVFFHKYDGIDGGEKYYIDEKRALLRKWFYFFVESKEVTSVSIHCRIRSVKGGGATGQKEQP